MKPFAMLAEIKTREKTNQNLHTAIGITVLALFSGLAGFAFWVMSSADQPSDFGVANVQAAAVDGTNSVTLAWTASGDDGAAGQATSYDIRYSTATLNDAAWGFATAVAGEPTPKAAGQAESLLVSGLAPNTTYNFGMKTTDDAGNTSTLSNIATKTTAALSIPNCVENWSCNAWSTCTSSQQTRTCADQTTCGTTSNQPALTRACTLNADGTTSIPSGRSVDANDVAPNTVLTSAPTDTLATSRFSFTWTGVDDVTAPERLQYSYRLDTRAWSGWTLNNQVSIRNLTNGRHTLAVRSRDASGNVDPSPASATFTVRLQSLIAVGVERGGDPKVRTYTTAGKLIKDFLAFERGFRGGVQVAVADLGDDGSGEIVVAPGSGRRGEVRLFRQDGSRINSFLPYGTAYRDGVNLTAADVNGDGTMEIITAKQKGSANVRVFGYRSGRFTQVYREFNAQVNTGVSLAAGDLNGDGKDEIITGSMGSGVSTVRVFNLQGTTLRQLASRTNVLPAARSGVSLATGDLNNDGKDELLIGPRANATPTIRMLSLTNRTLNLQSKSLTAYRTVERAGVRLSTADINYDGKADILASYGAVGQPRITVFNGGTYAKLKTLDTFATRDRLILNHSSGT
ncbi:MAG: FG-GAP-like repeat-containing protein [bacterium]|nr:FG-GAP-like repeat-containing protein [bacterium]